MNDDITVNGVTYDADEVFKRKLLVRGAEPTDYEQYQFISVLVEHRNRKSNAGGTAQAIYRYDDLSDLSKFHEHEYPYYLDVTMTTVTDKKGDQIQQILQADFAGAEEMMLVPRKSPSAASSQKSTSTSSTTNSK